MKNGEHTTRTLPNEKVVEEVAVPDNENNTVANAFFEEKQDGDSLYWDFIGIEYVMVPLAYRKENGCFYSLFSNAFFTLGSEKNINAKRVTSNLL